MKFVRLFAILTMLSIGAYQSMGAAPTAFPETIEGKIPTPAVVRIFAPDDKTESRSSGTGTLVSPVYVVTAAHVVGEKGSAVEVLFHPSWDVVTGKVIELSRTEGDKGYDVALIQLDKPRSETPMPLGTKATLGGLSIRGYSHGPYTEQTGTYFTLDTTSRWGLIRGAQARNGDSGGPVVQNGKLVGILWGSIPDQTWFTPIEHVYKVLPQLGKEPPKKEDDAKTAPRQYSL
ncbi:MAG: serine protease [Desulfurellales bacterium]|nr:MAG: serine protease [Desulfurellales bacterium]